MGSLMSWVIHSCAKNLKKSISAACLDFSNSLGYAGREGLWLEGKIAVRYVWKALLCKTIILFGHHYKFVSKRMKKMSGNIKT